MTLQPANDGEQEPVLRISHLVPIEILPPARFVHVRRIAIDQFVASIFEVRQIGDAVSPLEVERRRFWRYRPISPDLP